MKCSSEEYSGLVTFYANKMIFDGTLWNLVSQEGNFMSFRGNEKVVTDTGEKYLYKCWLYKRVNPSLYYYFPMTEMFQGQRGHVSADNLLDICDYCTNTEAKLHILHPAGTPCECTPECSQLAMNNSCTGAKHDTSSTNCVSGTTTAIETSVADDATTTIPGTTTAITTKETETTTLPITMTSLSSTVITTTTKETEITSLLITTTQLSPTTTDKPAETTATSTVQTTAEEPSDPITTTRPTTSTSQNKDIISALDRIGLTEDAFVGVVSGSLVFVYLVVAIVGCACCVFILGRRRKRNRNGKESQENLVPEGANQFHNKSYLDSLPQVFHRIDE